MADTKVSALTSLTSPTGADMQPVVNGGVSKQISLATQHLRFFNQSTSTPGAGFATDTYLAGSSISIPSGAPYVNTTYRGVFSVSKTTAGTAAPVISLRYGVNGTTADTAILTFTFGAGTGVADVGIFEVIATFRTVGSGTSAVVQGISRLTSNLATTGLSSTIKALAVVSSGFDSTVASSKIGMSYNGGTSAVHTVTMVSAELSL